MPTTRRFTKGAPILDGAELFDELRAGRWVWVRHKAYHPGFIGSQSVRYLMECIEKGYAFHVVDAGERR